MYSSEVSRPGVVVNITFSEKVAFFPGVDQPEWLSSDCLSNFTNGAVPPDTDCDWNKFFEPLHLLDRSSNVNTWEFWYSDNTTAPWSTTDFVAFVNFTHYQLDPSPLTNPLQLVQALNVPQEGTSIVVDPSWALAAWSADAEGSIPANRTTLLHLIEEMQPDADSYYGSPVFLTIMHMVSLLPYSTLPVGEGKVDDDHPLVTRNGTVYVYAYALTSRTSHFAVVVAVAGVLVVLLHAGFALLGFRLQYPPSKSLPQFIISALEHDPRNEFAESATTRESVQTHFRVEHIDDGRGELLYRKAETVRPGHQALNGHV